MDENQKIYRTENDMIYPDEVFDKTKSEEFEKNLSDYTKYFTTLLKKHYKENER